MNEAYRYGYERSPYETNQSDEAIMETVRLQGRISGPTVSMQQLMENYAHMVAQDASEDMTMFLDADDSATMQAFPEHFDVETLEKALNMARMALDIVEKGGDQSPEYYIGSGSEAHDKAVEFLPLVIQQRETV